MPRIVPDPRRIKTFATEAAFEKWLARANLIGSEAVRVREVVRQQRTACGVSERTMFVGSSDHAFSHSCCASTLSP
jgi:hypothetical protein